MRLKQYIDEEIALGKEDFAKIAILRKLSKDRTRYFSADELLLMARTFGSVTYVLDDIKKGIKSLLKQKKIEKKGNKYSLRHEGSKWLKVIKDFATPKKK